MLRDEGQGYSKVCDDTLVIALQALVSEIWHQTWRGSVSVTLYVPHTHWEPDVQGHCWVCFPLTRGAASCFKIKVLLLYLRGTWRRWRRTLEGPRSYGTSRRGADLWIIWEVSSWRTHKHTHTLRYLTLSLAGCVCLSTQWRGEGGTETGLVYFLVFSFGILAQCCHLVVTKKHLNSFWILAQEMSGYSFLLSIAFKWKRQNFHFFHIKI